jgi:hypothetical protein
VLEIVVHENVTVSDNLDSEHLLIVFPLAGSYYMNLSDLIYKFIDWEWFQSLSSELISPRIQINSEEEANKVACDFIASIASAYRLLTSKITLSDINKDIPGLESLLKHKRRYRKLWQVTRDLACKT